MKTFGKVLIGLGTFVAGTYAGAFISAYVAEKVMDSPLDESVLRKHARTNKSKLDYTVLYTPKSSDPNHQFDEDATEDESDDDKSDDDKSTYYDSLLAFLGVSNTLFSVGEKVRIKMKDGAVLQYVRNNDGWALDSAAPDPNHISWIFYGDINLVNFNHYIIYEGDLILNIPFVGDAFEKAKLYKWHNGEITDTGIMVDRSDEDDSYDDNDIIFADYKGSVKTFDHLPKDPEIGDCFLVEDADNGKGCIYIYSKNGYVIPDITDGVSLNDIFKFKMDAPQDDTDTDITIDHSDEDDSYDDLTKDPEIGDKFWVEDAGLAKMSPYFAWSRGIRSYHCTPSESECGNNHTKHLNAGFMDIENDTTIDSDTTTEESNS